MYVIAISPRFSLGRSTPATRAIRCPLRSFICSPQTVGPQPHDVLRLALPLTLLVPRVLADHACDALPLDDLAVLAAHLDRRSDLHRLASRLAASPRLRLRLLKRVAARISTMSSLYLNRYVIRPRVRSYGDSSTFTRSPGRMRMKFMRIFPLTCASTRWPLSSSTRNIAFGSGSTTVPSTSIASSLAMPVTPP